MSHVSIIVTARPAPFAAIAAASGIALAAAPGRMPAPANVNGTAARRAAP